MSRLRTPAALCRAAILLSIAGVFGTWRSSGPVSLDGLEGPHDGWEVIVFGLIALTGVRALGRGSWLGIVTVLGGACVMVYASVGDLVQDGDILGGNAGWGIWLTIVASAALAAVALLAGFARIRGSMRADPRTSP